MWRDWEIERVRTGRTGEGYEFAQNILNKILKELIKILVKNVWDLSLDRVTLLDDVIFLRIPLKNYKC